MSSRRIKNIGIMLLCAIYLMTSCFVATAFATSSDAMNVEEGKYYIKNKASGLYMGGLDFYSIVHSNLDGIFI